MSNNTDNLTYEDAYQELQEILTRIEEDKVSVDELTKLLSRSKFLITFCQQRLKSTSDELQQLNNDEN